MKKLIVFIILFVSLSCLEANTSKEDLIINGVIERVREALKNENVKIKSLPKDKTFDKLYTESYYRLKYSNDTDSVGFYSPPATSYESDYYPSYLLKVDLYKSWYDTDVFTQKESDYFSETISSMHVLTCTTLEDTVSIETITNTMFKKMVLDTFGIKPLFLYLFPKLKVIEHSDNPNMKTYLMTIVASTNYKKED